MPLTEKQMGDLFSKLHKKFREADDVDQSLREIENEEDFLRVLSRFYVKDGDTILGSYESLKVKQVQAVLNRAKGLDISLADILNVRVFLLSFDSESEKREGISLYQCLLRNDFKFLPGVLHAINESYELEPLWRNITVKNREKIKTKLNEHEYEHEGILNEINRIEEIKSEGVQIDNTADDNLSETSLASDESTINSKSNSANESESRKDAANKAIVAGAICGVIAGLAVGGGLFAAGVALPISTMIGIAVASAVLTGLVAGGITYEMSKPSENLDNVDILSQQIYLSLGV